MNDLDGMDTLISCQEKPIRHFDGSASDLLAKDGVWAEPQEPGCRVPVYPAWVWDRVPVILNT